MRGSITSRTGQIRTDSPGRAISSSAVAMRGSWRTAARTASRSTVSRPASYRVPRPKAMSVTGKLPISRRMGPLLRPAGAIGSKSVGPGTAMVSVWSAVVTMRMPKA